MADIKKNLLLLFDRPSEPVFTTKGDNVKFELSDRFYTERYKPIASEIANRFDDVNERIPVKNITPPNINAITALARDEPFSLWIARHRKLAGQMIDIFMGVRNTEDLLAVACYARDRVNPQLFQYAYACALLHRPDTKDVAIPSLIETFPSKFVDSKVMGRLREETYVVDPNNRKPIRIPRDYTASDLEPEHQLWYFREDPGLNLHHWHWHLVYPYEASNPALVNKDRRGELFFYAHQQIIARYNTERLGNRLQRVQRYNDFRKPMLEGYFPKMDSSVATRAWPARSDNTFLSDINRETDQIRLDIADLERWRDRIFEAIHQMAVQNTSGQRIPLTADGNTDSGIDILGNIVESSSLSPNRQYYGTLHNEGHVIISFAHDPTNKHLESFGLINEPATAMRDPMFYRWHAFIDDIFQTYKEQLPPYTAEQLTWQNINVTAVEVQPRQGPKNTFQTFWNRSAVDFSRGLDFQPRGSVYVEFDHLNHTPFMYRIQVENRTRQTRLGMCRIFMAPKNDERNVGMLFRDQRVLMIEMDKFIVQLNPGSTVIQRNSDASSVTIPFEMTFRNVDANRPAANTPEADQFNVCGCGWPQHLLVPRGQTGPGQDFQLFVMISDYEQDKIDQDLVGTCNQAASFCGIRDRKYPDRRPMGYPFDRVPRAGVDTMSSFLTPNMKLQDVKVVFTDQIRPRPN
ncbi:phenoloxidase 2-like [Culicoides brevitarsis]|uniref:phenoloxidase 2-like n=1 Tax=Culicoides brevitarsis TaxID=469753 RepID=UPI00307C2E48